MANPELKGEGDKSMPGNQWPGPDVRDGALGDPRDMAKAGLLEVQSPDDGRFASVGMTSETGATFCIGLGWVADATSGPWAMSNEDIQGDEWDA